MNNLMPIDLLTSAKELKKYNQELYDFVKEYGFNIKPMDTIAIILVKDMLMIYVINKKNTQKYISNYVENFNLRMMISDYRCHKKTCKLIQEFIAAAN